MKTNFVSSIHLNTYPEGNKTLWIFRRNKKYGRDYFNDTSKPFRFGKNLKHKFTPWRKAVILYYLTEK